MPRAYYNEHDPKAAAWLRELIKAGAITDGDVDERSIVDVQPSDLTGYTQCHFFAGIGGWSLALRLAGWPDDRPVCTGSCPCQSFSAAGQQKGFADPRHLWPVWADLIRECRPAVLFGEQVEAAVRHGWLDLVQSDLEAEGYACGAVVLGAHSVGAPHIRQRLWWVAESNGRKSSDGELQRGGGYVQWSEDKVVSGDVAESLHTERRSVDVAGSDGRDGAHAGRQEAHGESGTRGEVRDVNGCGETFWSACDWIPCRDGKCRPVEPGTFPLASGVPARVGRLRGYGNAIVPHVAAEIIRAYNASRA